ncbi:MAG: class I SAM-dependent methyltransferase [Chitinophagaceae bacterium]|nr:class I SAM-dependent methyltransferase [Chitinophagaceae bacterium]
MNEYLNGTKLYGDDFSIDQIVKWHEEEVEGFSNLIDAGKGTYKYGYHQMNRIHGFNKIREANFKNVMGLGSAYGYEFFPIIEKIEHLVIVEPSSILFSNKIGGLVPDYIKPSVKGDLPFEDNSFDLITCFGTLHHIPNVSFVISELVRILKKDGYLLIREPIISMGDWQAPRKGLTKNERGIPVSFFEKEFQKYSLKTISKEYCFTNTHLLERTMGFLFKEPIYSYKQYVVVDKFIYRVLKKNIRYHATRLINKFGPQSIFYVIKKV